MSDGMTDMIRSGEPDREDLATKKKAYRKKVEEILTERLPKDIPITYVLKAVDFYLSLPYIDYDAPVREDNLLVAVTLPFILELQYKKEGTYGRSWCKRGEMDTFFNTARKFDRIENIMLNGAKDEVGESKVDTVGDLTSYGLLWLTYILRNQPEAFMAWVDANLK